MPVMRWQVEVGQRLSLCKPADSLQLEIARREGIRTIFLPPLNCDRGYGLPRGGEVGGVRLEAVHELKDAIELVWPNLLVRKKVDV